MMDENQSPIFLVYLILAVLYLTLLSTIHYPSTTILKPLPIIALLVLLGISLDKSAIKMFLMIALLFSVSGDILLTLPFSHQLEWGLGAFLLAHLAYIFSFSQLAKSQQTSNARMLTALACPLISGVYLWVIWPFLGAMAFPIGLYVAVIGVMTLMSGRCHWLCLLGAMLFSLSDSLIALETFVMQGLNLHFWVMLTYYLAQFLLILGALQIVQTLPARHDLAFNERMRSSI
jgi:uncharacterized membrane protein YhhN